MPTETLRRSSARYRVAIRVPLIIIAFAGAIWAGATVDIPFQLLFSGGAIMITALIILRSAARYPSAAALPLCILLMLESNVLATQFVARTLNYAPELGEAFWRLAGVPLYSPLEWSFWIVKFGAQAAPLTFATGMFLAYGGLALSLLLAACVSVAVRRDVRRDEQAAVMTTRGAPLP